MFPRKERFINIKAKPLKHKFDVEDTEHKGLGTIQEYGYFSLCLSYSFNACWTLGFIVCQV